MSLNFLNYKQPYSIRIIEAIFDKEEKEIDEDGLKIILFATEEGLSCRKTAEEITIKIEESTDIRQDSFEIIGDLNLNTYFHATPEIENLIDLYLDRAELFLMHANPIFGEIAAFESETDVLGEKSGDVFESF